MKACVYFPQTATGILELQKRIAMVHAEAVIAKLNSLELSKESKHKVIDEVIDMVGK